MKETKIKKTVRTRYANIAKQSSSCCTPAPSSSCCGSSTPSTLNDIKDKSKNISKKIGYSDADLQSVPEESNLGLGCGNPIANSAIQKGDTVLDLGSGAGFDCFLASTKVGPEGHIIGVDMTPEMIDKARENAQQGDYNNVEFRLGEIEHLPVADQQIDKIISNCVINLVPDKDQVFQEAYRVLKPGGQIFVSDIVLLRPLPEIIRNSEDAYVGCVAGAIQKTAYLQKLRNQGFENITIQKETSFSTDCVQIEAETVEDSKKLTNPELMKDLESAVATSLVSLTISADKPTA
ncbi:unnamed protein product [marine sediment metagenome]|uniref:Arsenite methyltransferase n=1 Tax=marine sediment metagenome TaxID=412755 RepID=X1G0V6_9ZZZZ